MTQQTLLVIDTDSYAGNFEREIVAYSTGMYDEYMGEDEGNGFKEWAAAYGLQNPDMFGLLVTTHLNDDEDYGMCYASIDMGPNGLYNSVRFAAERRPTKEELDIIKLRVEDYATKNNIVILGYRLITKQTITSMENI